jgi:hypothetical protein
MDGAYKSMNPFPSSTTSEETPVIAVQLEHGLVYRVLFHSTYQYSALMYTFYTPLDFLEYPYTKTGENEVDGLAPEVPSGRENPRSSLHLDKTNESDTSADESDTSADEPDGTGADEPDGTGSTGSLTCQHDPTLQLLICLGVESGLGHSFSMVVGDDGGVTCTGSSPNYRPGQFMILNDSSNNTYAKHIVSIQCVGLGPSKWFLAIVQNKRTKNEWKFIAEVRPCSWSHSQRQSGQTDRQTDKFSMLMNC